jgi:hypothetical protein
MSLLRKIERRAARQAAKTNGASEKALGEDAHYHLPVGQILSSPIKGDFLGIPLFGWVGRRDKTNTPLVMISLVLIRSLKDPKPRGTLLWELPVLPETKLATLNVLEEFNWDGRIWPSDPGWPTGFERDEQNIKVLLERAGLVATFAFPPKELPPDENGVPQTGSASRPFTVSRAQGPFLMPPLDEPKGEPDPLKLLRLQALCEDPQVFYPKLS